MEKALFAPRILPPSMPIKLSDSFGLLPPLPLDKNSATIVDALALQITPHLLKGLKSLSADEAAQAVATNLPEWCVANGVELQLALEGITALASRTAEERARGSLLLWARMVAISQLGSQETSQL